MKRGPITFSPPTDTMSDALAITPARHSTAQLPARPVEDGLPMADLA
jgi:hypothetical protein